MARSLLGSPIIKDYAGRINIWKIRVISNQTCGDFPEFGIKMDTALNTTYEDKYRGFIIDIDFGKAAEIIQALLPEYDYIITLSYCPLGIGRANSVFGGGVAMNGADQSLVDLAFAHEYGHVIGLLGDEYAEFTAMYPEGEPTFPNVTTVLDEAKIKWRGYLTLTTPSPPYTQGVGAFEGADYYTRGVYRPASRCVMNMWVQFCPVCQDEMVARLNELTGGSEAISTPNPPDGPTAGSAGILYTYSTHGSTSNLGHPVQYRFDWGDGAPSDWLPVGTATASKAGQTAASYRVKSQTRCAEDTSVFSGWSSGLRVELSAPPESISTPDTPSGPTTGTTGQGYSYSTGGSTSNLGHSVEYQFDWKGDGTDLSPYGSATQSKTWTVPGTYNVKARARCATDTSVVSNWSSPLSVSISIPRILVAPMAYDFENVKVKKSKTASFKVTNSGKANLSILSSTITGTDASMFTIKSGSGSKTIKPGKTLTIKVAFKPTSKGSTSANLEITSNDPVTPTIDIPLSGTGQ